LVPAYRPCTATNRTHGAPLSFGSCAPPQTSSSVLTVGTPDANGFGANLSGSVTYSVINGNSATAADEADVKLQVSLTDVRNNPSGTDYMGKVLTTADLQITDQSNAAEMPAPGTVVSLKYEFHADCVNTATTS